MPGITVLLFAKSFGEPHERSVTFGVSEGTVLNESTCPPLGVSPVERQVVGGVELTDLGVVLGGQLFLRRASREPEKG